MDIRMGSLLQGARDCEGTAIIIDVYRAFTTAAVAFSQGANRIILVSEVAEALALRNAGFGDFCMGEVDGIRPAGFDFGNSPFELSLADVSGKTLIQSTRAGTVGINAAINADKIYASSLVNARATAEAVLRDSPDLVSIVAMGVQGNDRSDEDEQCALYVRNLIRGLQPDQMAVQSLVLSGQESQKYVDPDLPQFHIKDREYALKIDTMSFAIVVSRLDDLMVATPEFN